MIEKILQRIDVLLKKANFETFLLGNFASKTNKFCFDLLVKKDKIIFSVKIFNNIDNLNPAIIRDIKSLSLILKSRPILIGIKNRYQKLDDNKIYIREDLPFITLNTFENLINNKHPYILARRGRGVVFLNGKLMKTLREKQSITRREISEQLGVTIRTVSAYENESMRPSESVAKKIIEILENQNIFKKIDVFRWPVKEDIEKNENIEEIELSDFEAHVQDIIEDIGISSYWYKKGAIPFKLSLYSSINNLKSDGFYPLFSGISEDKNKFDESSFKCLKMFTDIFQKTSLYIVNNNIHIPDILKTDKIPILKIKSLEKVDDEEEFIELIQEL